MSRCPLDRVPDPVRTRIRQGKGPIRKLGPDYLAYAIVDAIVDGYYPILELLGERLEGLEGEIVATLHASPLQKIHHIKRELLGIRRSIWPRLHSKWAYPILLVTMVVVAIGMIIYFRRKGWLGPSALGPDSDEPE